jgi:hypothetical protein
MTKERAKEVYWLLLAAQFLLRKAGKVLELLQLTRTFAVKDTARIWIRIM